ncbi:flagellin N-terminal helical domain-containing protein, partial [Rossellomorea vietnamensis]|uniref:flagellin N-terminal helical domain-containing protein n=1 Tax=Rossellomorea vietnamensis TaxID=218284 RepID=UPI0014307E80
MIINHNISALYSINRLKNQEGKLTLNMENLSSGLRINTAADDSAGLAISEKMRAQIRGLTQAQRNVQDGIALLDTVEGALSQILNPPLQRIRELVIQSENDTLTKLDRMEIQKEIEQQKRSINDISQNTHFNNKNLIDGSFSGEKSVIREAVSARVFGSVDLTNGFTIVQGNNDRLEIRLDGIPTFVQLDEGFYTVDELLNEINHKFMDKSLNVIASYQNQQLSLNHNIRGSDFKITNLSGNLVESIFLSVKPGQDFQAFTKVSVTSKSNFNNANPAYSTIIKGINDTLSYKVDNEEYEITLTAGTYGNRQQIKDEINARLIESGAPVRFSSFVIPGGTLAINQLEHIAGGDTQISNIGGDAASFLFNYKWSDEWLRGNRDLSNGIIVNEGQNDILELKIDGSQHLFQLKSGTYSPEELLDELNGHFWRENIKLRASIEQGYSDERLAVDGYDIKVLEIKRTSTNTGNVNAIQFTGSAFTDLFMNVNLGTEIPEQSFSVLGNADLSLGLLIEEGVNDTLSFYVDDNEKTLLIESGDYTSDELLDELNAKLVEINSGVTALYENDQLMFIHNYSGANHEITRLSGNAFTSLFLSHEKGTDETLSEPRSIQLQIGANEGQSFSLAFMDTQTAALGLMDLSVLEDINRNDALNKVDYAIGVISSERSKIGAYHNRLNHTVKNLEASSENLSDAESLVRDADLAKEMMSQTKNS